MNGTNPYTDRRYGAGLSAVQGFLSTYMQREQAYMRAAMMKEQMKNAAVNRQYRQAMTELVEPRKKHLEAMSAWYRRRPTATTNIKIFSPGQTSSVTKAAENALDTAPSTKNIWWKRGDASRVLSESAMNAYKKFRSTVGYDYLSPPQQEQADSAFDTTTELAEKPIDWEPESENVQKMRPYGGRQERGEQATHERRIARLERIRDLAEQEGNETMVAKVDALIQKETSRYGGETPSKSPYPDYPDAFQENGVWKVIRNGKKYKIEE
jgi:hypothetical protein